MKAESGYWSEDKLKSLQKQLTGVFAEDNWPMKTIPTKKGEEQCHLHFDFTSPSLKIEFKYAVWFLFESRTWKRERDQRQLRFHLNCLSRWLNHVAPTASSLLERSLDSWEWSLRSYLVETNQLRQSRRQNLRASQEYVEYAFEDRRLGIFRHLYRCVGYLVYPFQKRALKMAQPVLFLYNLCINRYVKVSCITFYYLIFEWIC